MKRVPFSTIKAAKTFDPEAVILILRHFEGYIASRCLSTYTDEEGKSRPVVDDDLRYQAELALFAAIAGFEFREPPEAFRG